MNRNVVLTAIYLSVPGGAIYAEEIEDWVWMSVCAVMEGGTSSCSDVEISVYIDDVQQRVVIEPTRSQVLRLRLPFCDESVLIFASQGRTYEGRSHCTLEPSPLEITVKWRNRVQFANIFEGAGDVLEGEIDIVGLFSSAEQVILSGSIIDGSRYDELLRLLSDGNLPKSQKVAGEVADALMLEGYLEYANLYSSLALVLAFRAIGLEPLSAENPLVMYNLDMSATMAATEINEAAWHGLLPTFEGSVVLKGYQEAVGLPTTSGGFAEETANWIAVNVDFDSASEVVVPPPGFGSVDFFVNEFGRIDLRQ